MNSKQTPLKKFEPEIRNWICEIFNISPEKFKKYKNKKVLISISEKTQLKTVTIKLLRQTKTVRFAMGSHCALAHIPQQEFTTFCESIRMPKSQIEYFVYCQGDKPPILKRKSPLSEEERAKRHLEKHHLIQRFFNNHSDEITRFVFAQAGTHPIDYIVYAEGDSIISIPIKAITKKVMRKSNNNAFWQCGFLSFKPYGNTIIVALECMKSFVNVCTTKTSRKTKHKKKAKQKKPTSNYQKTKKTSQYYGNRGDWGEQSAYCELCLNEDIVMCQKEGNAITTKPVNINKIKRQHNNIEYEDRITSKGIEVYCNNSMITSASTEDIKIAHHAITKTSAHNASASYTVPEANNFLRQIGQLKLKSHSFKKDDINLTFNSCSQDQRLNIKDLSGQSPTLINASNPTCFIFEVIDLTAQNIKKINNMAASDPEKFQAILKLGGQVIPVGAKYDMYHNSISMIHRRGTDFISKTILGFLQYNTKNINEVLQKLHQNGELTNNEFNEMKQFFSHFLEASVLGITPQNPWDGTYSANGGILLRAKDKPLCIIPPKDGILQDVLYRHSFIDTPAHGRCPNLVIYEENGKWYFGWSLQVRLHRNVIKAIPI